MKKTIILSLVAMGLLFASCEKVDHAVNQKVTYYPVFDIQGGSTVAWQLGDSWVDPGFTAEYKGEDITSEVDIDTNLDVDTPGIYSVKYSFVNEDGFAVSADRTVVVYDVANASTVDIAGTYTKTTFFRNGSDFTSRLPGAPMKVTRGPGSGLFYMQDILCGFYSIGYDYGNAYSFYALVQLNKDNTIDILQVKNAWSYAIEDDGGSFYDPSTGTITINWYWGGWGTHQVITYSN